LVEALEDRTVLGVVAAEDIRDRDGVVTVMLESGGAVAKEVWVGGSSGSSGIPGILKGSERS
jgi:hypothetical protein